eukprot:jgi/Undpi1/7753/HiC_scaffold_23.g10226.m1
MLSAHNSIYPDSPDDGCEFPNGPIDGQQSLEEAFQEAEEPNSVGVQGSMFADPEPHVETDIQEGLMRTVVPPSSVVLDVEVEALIAIASSEPRTVRAHILHAQKRWLAGPAANTKTLCRNGTGSVLPTRRHDVLDRQHKRGADDVGYCLSRTVRSCSQYQASIALGAVGAGSQCRRGKCMAKAMSMFGGKGKDGIPAVVVEALCKF